MPDPDRVTGDVVSFTTPARVITVATGAASDVTHEAATLTGTLEELTGYDTADCSFEWREAGTSTWTETDPETRPSTGEYTADLSGLDTETEYEFRARGTASHDGEQAESTGEPATFTTDAEPLPEWQTYVADEGAAEESEIHVYEADAAGPVTVALNIHASEQTGVTALEDMLTEWPHPVESGTMIVWPTPCPSAAANETRTCNGEDLNEAFDLTDGPQTSVAQTIEDELVARNAEYLVDLHTRTELYESGGEGHAIFPSDDGTTRPISEAAVDEVNANYAFDPSEEWSVGNTVDEAGAQNDGMLATYAWETHGIHSQIGITWSAWNEADQIEQHKRVVATTLSEAGHQLGSGPSNLLTTN
ncbi:succinylglutamate desuccinylase/aspartoacylase family protein [Saliphagus sp. LR7]|uniref:succinylglutamate desuccinylase/aspartoacylase domain-containing protein n=1 Tax=Saliphagus sp. LR7 TaxID=2282654 RepID=UPI000DF84AD7|nr:succinylglutamate desuccinylase/aspartoacylase family protein [Saliphagus sp. LR7]